MLVYYNMTKKKSVKNINKNKNVNKNNINITIHPPAKRKYKKRATTTNPRQGQQGITIINKIPNIQQQEQQNIPKPLDLNKTAFNYNMPRHKPINTTDEDPRPPQSKAPLKVKAPLDDYKVPSKPLKNTNPMLNNKSSPLAPVEENTPRAINRFSIDGYDTPPMFESQVPLSGFNEDDSQFYPDDRGFLHLTTLKPTKRQSIYNDNNFSSFYNADFTPKSTAKTQKEGVVGETFGFPTFQTYTPTTYENDDDIPDLEP